MKKIYLLSVLFLSTIINAQNYTFLKTTATYADLTGTTSLNNGQIWDDPEYSLTLPFNFTVNGTSTANVVVNDSYLAFPGTGNIMELVAIMGNDLIDRGDGGNTSLSPIRYKTDGTTGNRITKIEFKNCGSFGDGDLTMFVNFQVWLYESTKVIEFRYGTSSITNSIVFYGGESGAVVGITTENTATEVTSNSFFLAGSAANPTTTTSLPSYINGTPPNGTLYRFTPTSLSNSTFLENKISIYPNPASQFLNVNGILEKTNFEIFDTVGKLILNGSIDLNQNTVAIDNLAKGMYILKMDNQPSIKFLKN